MKKRISALLVIGAVIFACGPASAEPHKYALSMFHCNIQYVIGGLYGFVPLPGNYPYWEIGPDETEDMIIREGFEPILDLALAHPNWTLTVELQGMYIEAMAERHPDVLEKLKTLVDDGGVELVSFHYSDQLFIATPYDDWKHGLELNDQIFADHDLTLSGAVFCQEGQGAEGMATAMAEEGYSVMAWPVNLWEYQHGNFTSAPYYSFGDVKMVVASKDVNDPVNEVYTNWTFMNDGELMATGDWDPYFPWFFHYRPESVAEYEATVEALEADGYKISGITDYVNDLIDLDIEPTEPPRLLDGTWQPDSTDGVSRWLGHRGLWGQDERDNHVRTLNNMAHREILAAETAAEVAGLDRAEALNEAWRQLVIAETSDGSGINPYRGEVEFCVASSAEALRLARDVIDEAKATLGLDQVLINPAAQTVTSGTYTSPGAEMAEGPFKVQIKAKGRVVTQRWFKLQNDPETWRLEIAYSVGTNDKSREFFVTFPGWGEEILTTTALIDDQVISYPRADFSFDHFYLPGPIGLIGLGHNWWVVKDMATVHVAAYLTPQNRDIRFEDLTAPWSETITWVFYLRKGNEHQALQLADQVNVHPTLAR